MFKSEGTPAARNELAQLAAWAERLRSRRVRPVAGEALGAELIQLAHVRDLIELEFATLANAFDDSGFWEEEGSASAVDWIRHHCHTTFTTARAAITVGDQAPQLSDSTTALSQGRIGYAHLALLARTTAQVANSPCATEPLTEEALLPLAAAHSVARFRDDCTHARHAADAQGVLQEHKDDVERRYLDLEPDGQGAVLLSGLLDIVGAATLRTALEPLARRMGNEDARHRARRLADALVELSSHALDQGTLPQRGSMRPHLQVTATLETLMGAAGAPGGEVEFAGPITAATVQRLGCDASVVRILLDADSAVVDVGRAKRTPPPATLRAVRARDKHCVWPVCDRSSAWTTAHHVRFWGKHNGPSDLPNLTLLCYRHHWLVHEGGWQLFRTDDGVRVIPPLGGYASRADVPDGRPMRLKLRDYPVLNPAFLSPQAPDTG